MNHHKNKTQEMTMRAVRFHDYRGLDSIRYEDAPIPDPADNEVLIRVHAAGVNPFDRYAIEGYVNQYVQFQLPAVLGRDVSGVVERAGRAVRDFKIGDAVYGQADPASHGTFADYTCVEDFRLAAKPDCVSHTEAASLPNVMLAAWDGLFAEATGANLQPGQTVLIHGAAGGIGSIAVQLAKWRGAHVIGTASSNNIDLLRQLGVDSALDYTSNNWQAAIARVDAVLDTTTNDSAEQLCALLRPQGTYVGLRGALPDEFVNRQANAGVRCVCASGPDSLIDYRNMAELVAQQRIKPVVSAVYPIAQVRDALIRMGERHNRGKIVLQIV
jgi:NADPH:quinone reductase-like Zn-dependent oxidoreductase